MATLRQDRDVRVGDYLDDKLQTLADLESLDSLLINVRNQQSLLQRQLKDARKDLQDARNASTEHGSSVNARVQKFHREQRDIDQRLLVVTNSDTSDDAMRRFEKSMDKLRRLDVTKGYVQLLKDVDSLR
jgi:RAD50-interacting protein 1